MKRWATRSARERRFPGRSVLFLARTALLLRFSVLFFRVYAPFEQRGKQRKIVQPTTSIPLSRKHDNRRGAPATHEKPCVSNGRRADGDNRSKRTDGYCNNIIILVELRFRAEKSPVVTIQRNAAQFP